MILKKIKDIFIKNRKKILLFSFFIIFILSIGDNVFAEGKEEEADMFIQGLNGLLTIASSFIAMLTALVSLLLSPGWINGTIFGFDIYLKEIWVLISNIVYFIFAFILIAISFMNIIGSGGGMWELKSSLPKFVIGVIMVPFTWFFVQFILSISAILTVAVLSLPYETMSGNNDFDKFKEIEVCNTHVINLTKKETDEEKKPKVDSDSKCSVEAKKIKGTEKTLENILKGEEMNGISGTVFGILNIYTYGIMKIDTIKTLDDSAVRTIKNIFNLGIKVIIDILFLIIYLILIIALFMALFARGIYLWIYAMFSPVFGLLFFFGKSKEGVNKISPLEFIKLALIPVYVSAALAFGLLFMFVLSNGLTKESTNGGTPFFKLINEEGNTVTDIKNADSSAIEVGGFNFVMKGVVGGGEGIFSSMGNGLGKMILQLFGLAILWISVMAALKSSEITHNIVKPIISFGESIGSLVAKAPQYAPIIPTPKGAVSAKGMERLGGVPIQALNAKVAKNISPAEKSIQSLFGGGDIFSATDKTFLSTELSKLTNTNLSEVQDVMKKNINILGLKNPSVREEGVKFAEAMFKKGSFKKLSDSNKEKTIENIRKGVVDKFFHAMLINKSLNGENFTSDTKAISYSTNHQMPEGNSSNSGTESTTASSADTTTAKQNTAINIKNINNNTISTSREVGGDLSTIEVGGVDIKSELGDIIDFATGTALTNTADAQSKIEKFLKTKEIKIDGTKATDKEIEDLAKQILKETKSRMI